MPKAQGKAPSPTPTRAPEYADRLERLGGVWWKRLFDVQRPYREHLRRMRLGFVLDLGCGVGRNLAHLRGQGIGVDHNPNAIARCRARGLKAYVPEAFLSSEHARPGRFDSLLCAHVLEHMSEDEARALLLDYLPYVRAQGRVVLIVPQEAGQTTDPTHVAFINLATLHRLAREVGLVPDDSYSFPFPRAAGRVFAHNESVVLAHKP